MTFSYALIIGAGGQVAKALAAAMADRQVLFTSSSGKAGAIPCDLAHPASIREAFAEIRRRWPATKVEVFLAGALTHVDRCEAERELCKAINADAPSLVAKECKAAGYGLTYFSSEYVFGEDEYQGGKVGPFTEADKPNPTSWYGHCKLASEKAVAAELGDSALIVRTTMVFSYDPPSGMNFLMQYLRQFQAVRDGLAKPFRIPKDQISTPAYAPKLAADVVALRERGVGGIINLAGTDCLSREDLVKRVAKEFGFEKECHHAYEFVPTAELKQPAKRPLTAGLLTIRAQSLGLKANSLADAFEEIKRIQKS